MADVLISLLVILLATLQAGAVFWLHRQMMRWLRMRFVCEECQRTKLLMSTDRRKPT